MLKFSVGNIPEALHLLTSPAVPYIGKASPVEGCDFKKTVHFLLNRTNRCTGVPYKNDKAILAWETGNELQSPHAWAHEIAVTIKSIDGQHLVLDGRHATRLSPECIDDPAIDIVTTHHYPGSRQTVPELVEINRNLARGKKPYFVGEYGFVDTPVVESIRVMDCS